MPPDEEQGDLGTVTFRLEPEDGRVAHATVVRFHRRRVVLWAGIFSVFGSMVGWQVGYVTGLPLTPAALAGACSGAAACFLLLRLGERRAIRVWGEAGMFKEQTITARKEGFDILISDGQRTFIPWQKVVAVGKSLKGYVVFKMDNNHHVVMIPTRCFRSESHEYLFRMMATAWHAQATTAKDP